MARTLGTAFMRGGSLDGPSGESNTDNLSEDSDTLLTPADGDVI